MLIPLFKPNAKDVSVVALSIPISRIKRTNQTYPLFHMYFCWFSILSKEYACFFCVFFSKFVNSISDHKRYRKCLGLTPHYSYVKRLHVRISEEKSMALRI